MGKLTRRQRDKARARATQAALLAYRNRPRVHYTQGSARWSGISGRRRSRDGQYPFNADCSAFTTWCLWNALHVAYGKPDVVNGLRWDYGFTGTQIQHGVRVGAPAALRGDLVFYATTGSTPTHVAICVGKQGGRMMVVSHGNEAGPLYLPYNYRRIVQVRRHIFDGV